MPYAYFSHNGELLPTEQAVVPLSRVEYSYGFGVYESIRVSHGQPQFIDDHCQRLMKSAEIIGLEHDFTAEKINHSVLELIAKNKVEACNIKLLLIGGIDKAAATLDILCLNPLFPDRKLYQAGAKVITYEYEREFPQAKTLNMLSSYIAYKKARQAGAYDALLINRQGELTEGTRTNLFALKDKTLLTPPVDQVLPGVTRAKVIETVKQNGFEVREQTITPDQIGSFDDLFLTSTSSKILPLRQIDETELKPVSAELKSLMNTFDA